MALLVLAARNLRRNPRRTAVTLSGIIIGVGAVVFIAGFAGGFVRLITGTLAEGRMGSIQVHRAGYLEEEEDPLALAMPVDAAVEARMLRVPGVKALAPRIAFEAMVSNGRQGAVVYATAVEPDRERVVCPRRWDAVPSRAFVPRAPADTLVGRALLEGLGEKAGGTLMVTASGRGGGTNALDVNVVDSLGNTDPLQSRRRMEVTLAHAQELLGMDGMVTEYALSVDPDVDLDGVANALRKELGPAYEVHTWMELASDLADVVRMIAFIMSIVVVLLVLLVLSGIANTMLMAVHERTREIGMMLAMGMRRRRVMSTFVAEGAVLGVAGGILGALVGYVAVVVLNHTGFPVRPPGSEVDNYLRPVPSLLAAAVAAAVCALGAVLAALQPARRAAGLTPVEALRNE